MPNQQQLNTTSSCHAMESNPTEGIQWDSTQCSSILLGQITHISVV